MALTGVFVCAWVGHANVKVEQGEDWPRPATEHALVIPRQAFIGA